MDSPVKPGNDREGMSFRSLIVIPAKAGIPFLLSFPRKRESSEMDPPVKPGNDKKESQVGG